MSDTKPDIICFSSIDWDFIWQGHQEIMATLSQQGYRVLFVDNTGVRNPRLRDLPRIRHRLYKWWRSLQGFRKEKENLYIFSPLVLPFPYARVARWINRWLLTLAIRRWMYLMDFYQPVCWTFLPTPLILEVIQRIPHKLLIYHCVDSFAHSTPAAYRIIPSEEELLRRADLVFVTSHQLFKRASQWNQAVYWVPSGINLEPFERARNNDEQVLADLHHLKRPIIGYVGGVHQWLDQELLCYLARTCREYSFALIGPIQTETSQLRRESNIVLLGQKSHQDLPRYVKQFDVGIIPYRLTEYTNSVYPAKLNDYHAMGKPVVSTPLPEVMSFNKHHSHLVRIGSHGEEFRCAIEEALREDTIDLRERRIQTARENSWSQRIEKMQGLIQQAIARKTFHPPVYWPARFAASQRSIRFVSRVLIGCALLYGAIFHTPFIWFCAQPLVVKEQIRPSDAIVVFAGGVGESGEVSESYQDRVKQAVELYANGYAPYILYISGYTWTFQEADIMRALSESLGVPSSAVATETHVHNTYDYVLRVKEISAREGWKSVLVMTPPYHGRRTALVFSKNVPGLAINYVAVRTGYYAHHWGMKPYQFRSILHEFFGIVYYWWKGWI